MPAGVTDKGGARAAKPRARTRLPSTSGIRGICVEALDVSFASPEVVQVEVFEVAREAQSVRKLQFRQAVTRRNGVENTKTVS